MILRLRRSFERAHPVILAGSLFLMGCHDGATVPGAPSDAGMATALDGETFFRGVLLGRGPLTDEFRSLRALPDLETLVDDPDLLARARELENRLVDDIHTADPGYFERFEAAMTSGDHLRIRSALVDARRVVYQTALAWPEAREALERLRSDPDLRREALAYAHERVPSTRGIDDARFAEVLDDDVVLARIRALTLEGQGQSEQYILAGVIAFVVVGVVHWVAAAINVVAGMNFAVAVNVFTPCAVMFANDCDEFLRLRLEPTVHELAERYHRAGVTDPAA